MDNSKNRPNEYLGVNKIGKNIRKSPLHQPNFVNNGAGINNTPARQQPQPHVYNISKNDFRSIVQQLTGSPSHNDPMPRPPNNLPKHPSMRLQRIRPPPLSPPNRPPIPPVVAAQAPMQPPPQGPPMAPPPAAYNYNNFTRPTPQFGQPSPRGMQPSGHGDSGWMNPALSPISAYMQQLQSCIGGGTPMASQPQMQPQFPGQYPGQFQMQSQGPVQAQPQPQPPLQPQFPGQAQAQAQAPVQPQFPGQVQAQPPVQPQFHGQAHGQSPSPGLLPNPSMPPMPSPKMNGPALLPSPTSQFLLPSPSGFFGLLSPTPRSPSPYAFLSPGTQYPPPLSPNFAFSSIGQSGILGPGPQPPLSPGSAFPLSPGFFAVLSPRWRDP